MYDERFEWRSKKMFHIPQSSAKLKNCLLFFVSSCKDSCSILFLLVFHGLSWYYATGSFTLRTVEYQKRLFEISDHKKQEIVGSSNLWNNWEGDSEAEGDSEIFSLFHVLDKTKKSLSLFLYRAQNLPSLLFPSTEKLWAPLLVKNLIAPVNP